MTRYAGLEIRRVTETGKVLSLTCSLKPAAAQMGIECLTVFNSNKAIHVHGLSDHTMCRQRMTADDKQRM